MTTLSTTDENEHHHRRGLNTGCREQARGTQLPKPLSPSSRSQTRNWNTPTEANMSSMNRNSTQHRIGNESRKAAEPLSLNSEERL